jgi:hypothetical protein
MNSDGIKLVQETYGPLQTTGAPLTVTEFDDNNIAIYKDFESLAVTIGVPAYDAGTDYNNDVNDSTTETFATYGNRFWQWINATDGQSTPSEGSDWTQVFPTMLAHEKNKDDKLKTIDGFTVKVDDSGAFPTAQIEYDDPGSDWVYGVGVQDLTGSSGDKQCALSAYNSETDESFSVRMTDSVIEMKHVDGNNDPTAAVHIEDSKVILKTPKVLAGNATVGDRLEIKSVDGEMEVYSPGNTGLRIGFADYSDAGTTITPITFTASSAVILTNDAAGPNTIDTYLPNGVTSVWDDVDDEFDWSELALGDMVDIRLDVDVITNSNNQEVIIELIMNVGASEYSILFIDTVFKTSGTHKINRWNGIYMGNTATQSGAAELRLTSDGDGSVVVNGWYCKITKN